MNYLIRSCTVLLLSTAVLSTSLTTNDTLLDELRRPRVVGRIVKLYSGSKPDPIVCAREGYQEDPADCAVFYRCIKGGKEKYTVFRFQCGPGTIYDPDTEICNHPKNTKRSECFTSIQEVNAQTEANENEIDFGKTNELPSPIKINKPVYATHNAVKRNDMTITTVNPLKATTKTLALNKKPRHPNQEGDPCITDGFMGDSEDCRKFYRCVGNGRGSYIRYEFSCSQTTVWDDEVQSCNHPTSVKRQRCRVDKDTENVKEKNQQNTPDTDAETIQEQIQMNYGSKVSQSQVQINKGSAIQNQTQVNYGDRVHQSQRQENYGKESNQNKKQLTKGSAVSQTQTQVNYGDKAIQSQVQIDHTKQTSQTQTQVSETNTEADDNDNDGGYNNNNQENPQEPQVTESNIENSDEKQCASSGFMGDLNNCKKFYRCVDNGKGGYTRYEFSCGEGTVWDASIEGCNHAWAVKTCDEQSSTGSSTTASSITSEITTETTPKTTARPETTSQTTSTSGDDDDDTGYGNQNPASPPTTSVKPTNAPETSTDETVSSSDTVCTHSGFIGDASDCNKFYRCVDNGKGGYTKYEFSCGDGTVWDSEIQACNHAWAVQRCGGVVNSDFNKEELTTQKVSNSEAPIISKPSSTTQTNEPENTDVDNGYGQPVETPVSVSSTTETQQTQSPGSTSNKECQSNGFMGDENDCKKFYRCVDDGQGSYTRYEFSCGEGTVWDQTIQGCNHAWAVKKCGGSAETQTQSQNEVASQETVTGSSVTFETDGDQGYNSPVTSTETALTTQGSEPSKSKECNEEGFFGDENDCRKFYRCVDNGKGGYTKYEFECGEGTVWDSAIKGCNHPSESNKCGSSGGSSSSTASPSNKPEPENDEMYTETTSKATTASDTSQTSQPVTTGGPETSTGTCEMEGFHPEPNDCKKFYRCVDDGNGGFTKYDFTCGEGTVWDQNIQGCNHESESQNCKSTNENKDPQHNNQQNQESSSQESTTKDQTTAQEETSTETQTTTVASGNQGECTADGFYANPANCKKFYRCVSNGKGGYTRYDFTCGEGTVWDQNIMGCNHESDSRNCSNSSSNTNFQENHETSTQQSQGSFVQESTTEGQQSTQEGTSTETQSTTSPNGDQGECATDGFYANPSDCKKFYRCVGDGKGGYTRYDFVCGEGTVWVQEIQACDHDNDVNSCSSQNSDGSFTSSTQTTQQINTEDSNHQASTSTASQTQADDYPTESPSSSSSPAASSGECKSEGFYGNENDCTKFFRCVDNGSGGYTKYDFTCGEGTAWDPNIQACNHKSEVDSCKGSSEEKPGTQPMHDDPAQTTQSTTSTATSTESVSTTMTSTSGPCKNDSDSEKPSSKDKCTKEGYYGNSQDCTKFYRCVDNGKGGFTKYDFQCGEGTIWDQDITACNHPNDVNNPTCNNQGQHTDTSSSTTSNNQEEPSSTAQSTSSTTESNNEGASNCTQEESSKKPDKIKVNCTKAGFYPDPDNCKKFYRCVDWDGNGKRFSIFHFDCGEGTIWDPALDTCNYEDSVYPPRNCSGQETQSESTHETTTTSKTTTEPNGTTIKEQSSTTTQQTTTQETTTQQSSTNEETTTQQITTTEQTTSEQPTTSEQTTTEVSPTTQQTTTEESITTQQTTTEQLTTQQTTTEQPATSEQTTTEQSTTSEQTTTEQSTSNESTTTEQSTTSEQTTTEQSTSNQTSSESTTIEESTTTEHTTTEQPTTNQTTTEQATTTEPSTTQESTTMQSTTTEETSTQQTTSEQSTTDSSTAQESTTQQQETSTTESSTGEPTSTEQSSSKPDKCPETDDDQYTYVCPTGFRRHPKYCNLFYQCTEDDDTHEVKVATFTCPNNTIYDESKTQCVEESKADKKCDGQIAQKSRVKRLDAYIKEPMVVNTEKHSCPAVGHFPFERQDECSPAFLKCERSKTGKVRGFVYQCPNGFVYWAVSRRCEPQAIMRSCKQAASSWSGRWEIPVERRNVAP